MTTPRLYFCEQPVAKPIYCIFFQESLDISTAFHYTDNIFVACASSPLITIIGVVAGNFVCAILKIFSEEGAVLRDAVFLALAVCLIVSTAGATNLLTNGDFESGTAGWTTWSWGTGFVGTGSDPSIQLDGTYLYAGQSGAGDWDGGGGAYQLFPAKQGDEFYVSAMAKAEGATPRATLVLVYLNASQVEITREEYDIANWSPLAIWTFGEISGYPAPSGTAYVKVEIANNGGRGTAYFDNVYADFTSAPGDPDYDSSGEVNVVDFVKLASDWLQSSSPYDLDADGDIDNKDFQIFAGEWLGQGPQYQLAWSDEFDGSSLNTLNWSYDVGDGCPDLCGWGNNELQYYRSQNVSVSGGYLILEAREEAYGVRDYTSGKIHSRYKQDFLYGKVEARMKVPTGGGMWPAFWMMPTDSVYGGWAASGEIDIMETSNDTDYIGGTIHYGGPCCDDNRYSGGTYSPGGVDFSDAFHVYTIEWEPDVMRWYVDGVLYSTKTSSQWYSDNAPGNPLAPFDQYFYIIMNAAVGGRYTGCESSGCITASFPQQYQVDWVRVYQKTE